MDFVTKSGSGKQNIEKLDAKVKEQSGYLKDKLLSDLRKMQVKIHAKYLMSLAEAKIKTEQDLKNIDIGQERKPLCKSTISMIYSSIPMANQRLKTSTKRLSSEVTL